MLQIDGSYLLETVVGLVEIDSVNPSLVPGAAGEARIAEYVAGRLEELGLRVTRHEPEPGRVSVLGRLVGGNDGRSLMLNAHYDTVGVEDMRDPFSARVEDGRLYGRGAYDMKGSLAAQMAAVKALLDAGINLQGDLLIAAVADEEYASIGTADLLNHCHPDGAIVTEPTALQTCLAHKGFIWLQVETRGRAAHGSRFDLGIDANMRMGRVLSELDRLEQALRQRAPHPLVGPPSLHAATLQGGTELSMYAASCRLGIERRTVPGEDADQIMAEIQQILERLAAADDTFQAQLETLLVREPFEVAPEAPVVRALDAATATVLGEPARHIGDTPWMDSALLAAAGVESVVIGPAGAGAHAAEEWVDLHSLEQLAAILAETAIHYCGTSP
ncbi:MAG TPA: ArgE/DapE family deacylase [Candidatus Sulfomarinibacteraceae bacterium]|nr:ArgE/DapE family deacylase [Candidatus Sulfomarinibacteraceae bacterium]